MAYLDDQPPRPRSRIGSRLASLARGSARSSKAAWVCVRLPLIDKVLIVSPFAPFGFRVESETCENLAETFHRGDQPASYSLPSAVLYNVSVSIAALMDRHAHRNIQAPAEAFGVLRDAIVMASGFVFARNGAAVAESLVNSSIWYKLFCFTRRSLDGPFFGRIPFVSIRKRRRQTSILLKQTYDSNYGHWLTECLPKLVFVASQIDITTTRIVVAAHHDQMRDVYVDSLAAFGVPPDQIDFIGTKPVVFDRLIYPLPITDHPWVRSPRVVDILETIPARLGVEAGSSRRLYVSRNRGASRRVLNEEAVIAVCEKHGFVVVYPETLSFREQVALFSGACFVVGNYGANLTNVVFGPRGLTLFALTTQEMCDDFFWTLASQKQGRYLALHGKAVDVVPHLNSDFTVDVALFEELLEAELLVSVDG